MEKELERDIIAMKQRLSELIQKNGPNSKVWMVEVHKLLERTESFIDYAKFHLGEDITEGV